MKKAKILTTVLIAIAVFASCTPDPQANFSISSDAIDDRNDPIVGEEIEFTNLSLDADTYEWDFGDGEESSKENPSHAFEEGGEFEVTLVASNKKGSSIFTMDVEILSLDGDWECVSVIEYGDGTSDRYVETLDIEQVGNELEGDLEGVDLEDAEVDGYEISFSADYSDASGSMVWIYTGEINEDYDEMEGEITIVVDGVTYDGFTWTAEKESGKSSRISKKKTFETSKF